LASEQGGVINIHIRVCCAQDHSQNEYCTALQDLDDGNSDRGTKNVTVPELMYQKIAQWAQGLF
jgi:hypothetical protein